MKKSNVKNQSLQSQVSTVEPLVHISETIVDGFDETIFETIDTPLEPINETIDTPQPQQTFELPTRGENENDVDYAKRVATALAKFKKPTEQKTSDYKPKLSLNDAIDIMHKINDGVKMAAIAKHYGVHDSTISDIKAGRLYKNARETVPFAPKQMNEVVVLQTLPTEQPQNV